MNGVDTYRSEAGSNIRKLYGLAHHARIGEYVDFRGFGYLEPRLFRAETAGIKAMRRTETGAGVPTGGVPDAHRYEWRS